MECVLVLVLFLCLCVHCSALSVSTVNVTGYKQAGSYLNSSLYVVDLPPDSGYDYPPMLVHLTGSRHGEADPCIAALIQPPPQTWAMRTVTC